MIRLPFGLCIFADHMSGNETSIRVPGRTSRWGIIRCAVVVSLTLSSAAAQDSSSVSGPLVGLPSPPGPHIDKIKAMEDNTWLELGVPVAGPRWGRARGRSWTSEMPLAPELRGAFIYGEGRHGYVKPDGHYMDDLWFYDLNGHRWICCYPGADSNTRLTINRDGFETSREGQLVPVAQQAHGYEMNTYDIHLRRFMSMPNTHSYWRRAIPQRDEWFAPPPADASPWLFETTTGHWNRERTGGDGPNSSYGDTFIYLPRHEKAFFLHRNQDVWLYDTRRNQWEQIEPQGPAPPFGIDAVSCYDDERDRVYIGGGSYPVAPGGTNALWIYDLKSNTWIDLKPKGVPCNGSNSYPTKNAVMVYDRHHDVVLLVLHSHFDDTPEKTGVYIYDPETNAWLNDSLPVPDRLGRNRQPKNGFFDPELGVLFLHSAGDSDDNGTVWVYRYKGPK